MEEGEYESVLCVKPEVHVYRIPPRATNRGYRAAEWQLDQPSWSGRLRITAKGQVAYIKLEDRTSGELFAQAPVDQFPGTAVESVTDSSRYFVIRIEDGNGRRAFIGIGFGDRGDAFDFNVALQDHFKWVKQQCEFAKQAQNPDLGPKLDLGFKEGQTIKLNIAEVPPCPGHNPSLPPPPPPTSGETLPNPQGRLPARLNQAQAGSSSDLSAPLFFLVQLLERSRLTWAKGRRTELSAASLCLEHDPLLLVLTFLTDWHVRSELAHVTLPWDSGVPPERRRRKTPASPSLFS
ncbi:adaptin ear-binding coat-associated protein 2 isoform X1 [Lynx canadensis]|uniref:adaptin ear-binding coat-associated protein 2 isoform X1 n=1 Tax=Lynx canadensis TaxID=61383 RepID=UPI0011B0A30E|nr:adaptin ear-binding coat-associated protein 2 isoform X1 [Lynx canadensis]